MFSILSNPDNKVYMDELVKYGKQNNINVEVSYADDLEAMDVLKECNDDLRAAVKVLRAKSLDND